MEKLYFKDIKHFASRSAIRHWQRVGLLPDEREAKGNLDFRTFEAELLPRIEEIARLRKAGLSCMGIGLYLREMDQRALEQKTESDVNAKLSEYVHVHGEEPPTSSVLLISDNKEADHAQAKNDHDLDQD